jgi:hypothetical protein
MHDNKYITKEAKTSPAKLDHDEAMSLTFAAKLLLGGQRLPHQRTCQLPAKLQVLHGYRAKPLYRLSCIE